MFKEGDFCVFRGKICRVTRRWRWADTVEFSYLVGPSGAYTYRDLLENLSPLPESLKSKVEEAYKMLEDAEKELQAQRRNGRTLTITVAP